MTGEPRQPAALGEPRERDRLRRGERARAAHVDVETGIAGGRLDVERLGGRAERLGDRPGGFERAAETGRQDRAVVDRDDVVAAGGREPDLKDVLGAAPGMEDRAPAALAMGVDDGVDGRVEPRIAQRRNHEVAFPGAIARGAPMLDRAAAADAEMRTDRRDPLGTGHVDPHQMPAVRVAGP